MATKPQPEKKRSESSLDNVSGPPSENLDIVDEADQESFPASDAPPWTSGREPVSRAPADKK